MLQTVDFFFPARKYNYELFLKFLGVVQQSRPGNPSVEVANLTTSRELGVENDRNFEIENRETVEESNVHPVLSRSRSSRLKEAEKKLAPNKVPEKQSNVEADMWWLNLPYVLVRERTFLSSFKFS